MQTTIYSLYILKWSNIHGTFSCSREKIYDIQVLLLMILINVKKKKTSTSTSASSIPVDYTTSSHCAH